MNRFSPSFAVFTGTAGFFICALILPSRSAQTWFSAAPGYQSWLPAAALGFALGAAWFYRKLARPLSTPWALPSRYFLPVCGGLGIALIAGVISHLPEGFNVDEHQQVARFLLDLDNDGLNHFLTNRLTRASLTLFGLSKTAARLPALLFSLFFLLLLFLAGARKGDFRTALPGVLGHFLVNGLLAVYLHSARGYSGAMLFSAIPFWLVYEAVRTPEVTYPRAKRGLLFVSLVLGALCHFFCLLASLILFASLAAWLYGNQNRLPEGQRKYCRSVAQTPLWFLPVAIWLVYRQSLSLSSQGWWRLPPSVTSPAPWSQLFFVFGYARSWAAKLAAFLFLLLLAHLSAPEPERKWWQRFSLESWFTLFSVTGFAVVIPLLGVGPKIQPRFFLPFLLPLLVWLFSALAQLRGRTAAVFCAGAFLFLLILPVAGRDAVHSAESNDAGKIELFFGQVSQHAGFIPTPCYTCAGDWWMCQWARFYLEDQWRRPTPATCPKRYLFYLKENSPPGPESHGLKLLYTFDQTYSLFAR